MRTLLLLSAGILLLSFSVIRKNNSLTENHLKGKVKCIKVYEQYRVGDTMKTAPARTIAYDTNGNETTSTEYINDTVSMLFRRLYSYNEQHLKTEEYDFDPDGSVSWKEVYSYDKEGRLAESIAYNGKGNLMYRLMYEYDNVGNNSKIQSYDRDGKPRGRTELKYDAKGRLVTTDEYGNFIQKDASRWQTEYDTSEQIVAGKQYDRYSGEINLEIDYYGIIYDSRGNRLKWSEDDPMYPSQYHRTCIREISYY